MAFGLTDDGFIKKTLTDILAKLDADVKAVFGAANVEPDSVFGQMNGIIAEVVGDLWDLAELTYASQYALSAKGVSMDAVAELNNLTRLGATASTVNAILEGDDLTTIPLGTQFRQTGTDEIFASSSEIQLNLTTLLKVVISVNDFATTPHTIDIVGDGEAVFSSSVSSSALDVLNDFQTQINTAGKHNAVVDVSAETLTITNLDLSDITTFGIIIDATLTIDEQWSPVSLAALNTGAIAVPSNSIQIIETPVVGLNAVDNLSVGTQGRDVETDDDFRLRRKQSIRVVGAATVPAMEARLVEEIVEIVSATVKDNRTDFTDVEGRPPHSFEAIITFSPDTAAIRQIIADKIFEIKPAGIQTFGTITEQVSDSTGDLQTINYSQPTNKFIHINVEITLNPEEVFPVNGLDAIKTALADFGNDLNAGEDAIIQRFFNSIYSVSGVENIELFEFATTVNPGDTPTVLDTSTVDSNPSAGEFGMSGAQLITNGVVTGMVVKKTGGVPASSVKQVLSETNFISKDDVFFISDVLQFGGFGDTNIGIAANEITRFDELRIAVVIV